MLPPGGGAELTQKLCGTTCHTVETFNGLRRSASDWTDTVDVMIAYGASMDQDQTRVVVQYLGQVFGPASPPLLDANRAEREDLEKLPRLHRASIDMMINHRARHGEFKSVKQIEELLGAAEFEKIKGYVLVHKPARRARDPLAAGHPSAR